MPAAFERHAFVALTSTDIPASRAFWVDALGLPVLREEEGHFFMVDAGGVRLCLDLADGDLHRPGSSDPVVGLKVGDLDPALVALKERGLQPFRGPVLTGKGRYAVFHDPDGHPVVVTEFD
jgi:catechol 2,3-dioxygenase-like lactoylglutathione lyase family enzyme